MDALISLPDVGVSMTNVLASQIFKVNRAGDQLHLYRQKEQHPGVLYQDDFGGVVIVKINRMIRDFDECRRESNMLQYFLYLIHVHRQKHVASNRAILYTFPGCAILKYSRKDKELDDCIFECNMSQERLVDANIE